MKVVVCGLGKVGLPLLQHLKENLHHDAVGFDTNSDLTQGDLYESVWDRDAAFIIVPTPQDGDLLSGDIVRQAIGQVRSVNDRCLILVVSTLDPREAADIIKGPNIVYTPCFIRLGSVVEDLDEQAFLLIGAPADSENAVEQARRLWGFWEHGDTEVDEFGNESVVSSAYEPPVFRSDPTTIATAKLAINSTLSSRIAWANDIAARAKSLGADSKMVLDIVGADPRIGSPYLKSGFPPGGPCLPRDLDVWTSVPGNGLAEAVLIGHRAARNRVVANILDELSAKPVRSILVVGLTYKEDGLDWTNALGMEILKELKGTEYKVYAYDREGTPASMVEKFGATKVEANAPFNSFDAIIVGFLGYPEEMAKKAKDNSRGLLVINPWR